MRPRQQQRLLSRLAPMQPAARRAVLAGVAAGVRENRVSSTLGSSLRHTSVSRMTFVFWQKSRTSRGPTYKARTQMPTKTPSGGVRLPAGGVAESSKRYAARPKWSTSVTSAVATTWRHGAWASSPWTRRRCAGRARPCRYPPPSRSSARRAHGRHRGFAAQRSSPPAGPLLGSMDVSVGHRSERTIQISPAGGQMTEPPAVASLVLSRKIRPPSGGHPRQAPPALTCKLLELRQRMLKHPGWSKRPSTVETKQRQLSQRSWPPDGIQLSPPSELVHSPFE